MRLGLVMLLALVASQDTVSTGVRSVPAVDLARYAIRAEGRAKPADPEGPPGRLKVRFAPAFLSFLPMVWADCWILDLTPDDGAAQGFHISRLVRSEGTQGTAR